MSATPSERPGRGSRYHHGDLRAALVDAAIELVGERGVRAFSLAEASRRVGVSVAAPYRHFTDRDELLAAVAVRALETFTAMVAAEATETDAARRLAAMTHAYVRFAAEQRPLFETLFHAGLDKSRYPDLMRAYESVDALFLSAVNEICEGDAPTADTLAAVLEASAHGHAALLLDGEYGDGADAVRAAAAQAARAAHALIDGRNALDGSV